ncbi:MAG TPA: hypothetical protein VHO47_01125 [Candidatus Babeliales bacterium]|nr:hypothetical protein [Candidatus Babeliales bacterium]
MNSLALPQSQSPQNVQVQTQPGNTSNTQGPIASTPQQSPADIQNGPQPSSTNAPYAIPQGSRFYFNN